MVTGAGRFIRMVFALALAADGPAAAQGRDWSPADRAVIGDFTTVVAVAASTDRVFSVTPDAILVYDPQARRWDGPHVPRDPGLLRDVLAALADPLDQSLWLVRRGGWIRFDPQIRVFDQGFVTGTVLDAALDQNAPASGLFLRTSTGWYSVGRGGAAIPSPAPSLPLRPTSVEEAVRANPAIQATSAGLLFQARLRPIRYTAAARASGFLGQGWYLGTSGAGLVYFADGAGLPEQVMFGLPGEAVSAVFAGPGGVWAVTERTIASEPALSFVGAGLNQFRWYQGSRARGLPFTRARRVVGRGSALWLATDAGAIRITPSEEDTERFDEGRGLPDSRVYDLAQRRGRLVAATAHGLAEYADSTGFTRLAPDFVDQAVAVALSGDTTWVATRLGLFAALPTERDLLRPDALGESVVLQAQVVDLDWRGDTLVALTPDRLLWRDPGSGRFTAGPLLGSALGRLHTLVNGVRGLYLAGERGVGVVQLQTPLVRQLTVPADLPGQVTDLAVDEEYLWVATLRGLVRFRLDLVR